jgi:ornithine carbamoyltransferase
MDRTDMAWHQQSAITTANRRLPADPDAILSRARALHAEADGRSPARPLQGRHIALLTGTASRSGGGEEDALLTDAAIGLGAQVAHITTGLWPADQPDEIRRLAGILGKLYVAVACQRMAHEIVQRIAQATSIPVFDCITADDDPSAGLVERLDIDATRDEKRRLVLQAILLSAIA